MFLKLSLTVDDIFRKLERVKRIEKKKKLARIQNENNVVRKYAQVWKQNVFEGIRQQPYSIFIEAQKQAARFGRRKSCMTVGDMDSLKEIRRQKEIIEMKIDCLINGKDSISKVFVKSTRTNALHKVQNVVSAASTFADEANESKKVDIGKNFSGAVKVKNENGVRLPCLWEKHEEKKGEHHDIIYSDSSYTRDDDTLKTTWMRSLSDSGFESKEQEEKIDRRRVTTALPRPSKTRLGEIRRRELRQLAETKRLSAEPGAR